MEAGRARVLQIRYTANSFADPRRVRFRYRLVGHDKDWREETPERVAYYTNLRPGAYHFEVKAANHHGVWNETPAVFPFSLAPHFWQTWPFYVLCALAVLGVASRVQTYRLRVQRRILKLEQGQALQQERVRIAQDLHDDLGANLTGLALKADLAHRQPHEPSLLQDQLESISRTARALSDNVREAIWVVNPGHDTLESLAAFLARQVEDFAASAGLRCRLDIPASLPALSVPGPARHHLWLAVKEALHNAVKHAAAQEVRFGLDLCGEELRIRVEDDGRGFVVQHATKNGHGLANMRQRIEELGGRFELESVYGQGTRILIRVPTILFNAHPRS